MIETSSRNSCLARVRSMLPIHTKSALHASLQREESFTRIGRPSAGLCTRARPLPLPSALLERGGTVSAYLLFEEFHLTVLVPADLEESACEAIHRILASRLFYTTLDCAVRQV